MVNLLVAAALAGASPASVAPATPVDQPAMFVVHDADTTVYIFGTFHALDGRSQWLGDRIRERERIGTRVGSGGGVDGRYWGCMCAWLLLKIIP